MTSHLEKCCAYVGETKVNQLFENLLNKREAYLLQAMRLKGIDVQRLSFLRDTNDVPTQNLAKPLYSFKASMKE